MLNMLTYDYIKVNISVKPVRGGFCRQWRLHELEDIYYNSVHVDFFIFIYNFEVMTCELY